MPKAEGIFPKVGGVPIYFSEANRFAGYKTFFIGSTASGGGGGAYVGVGSVLIGAGSVSNPCVLHFNAFASSQFATRIRIIGLSSNIAVTVGDVDFTTNYFIKGLAFLGSPGSGIISAVSQQTSEETFRPRQFTIDNLNTGSPFVFEVLLSGTAGGYLRNLELFS